MQSTVKALEKSIKAKEDKAAKEDAIKTEKAKRRMAMREMLEVALTLPSQVGQGTQLDAITAALLKKASQGDVKAYEVIRDTVGERPDLVVKNEICGENGSPVNFKIEFIKNENAENALKVK